MITQIEKGELREQIINACIAQQQLLMDDFRQRIKILLADQNLQAEPGRASANATIKLQSIDELDLLNDALIFAQMEMKRLQYLQSVNYMDHQEVELGAIVVTDVNTILISSSVDPFIFNGKNLMCIPTESSFFQKMKGKRKGDMFFHNRSAYLINDVF